MEKKIDEAIEILAKKITPSTRPEDAMKLTQAALNMAHVRQLIKEPKVPRTKASAS